MRLKYIFHEIKKNRIMSLLIWIQTAVVFVVLIGMISAIVSRYEKYLPIEKYLKRDGLAMELNSMGGSEGLITKPVIDSQELEGLLKQARVAGMYAVQMYLEGLPKVGGYKETLTMGYDEELLSCYTPVMESGRWLTPEDADTDEIEVVLALKQGGADYQVGDEILLKESATEKLSIPVSAKVVGILEDGADYLGFNAYDGIEKGTGSDFRTYYSRFDKDTAKLSMAFVSIKDIEHNSEVNYRKEENVVGDSLWGYVLEGLCFILYDSDITLENRQFNEDFINLNGDFMIKKDLSEVRRNSMEYIYAQMDILVPIMVGLVLLTLMSTVSNTAISMKQNMREYAVYYINGLTWNQCVRMHMKSIFLTEILTLAVTLAGLAVCQKMHLLGNTLFSFGIWQLTGCVAVILLFLFSSLFVAATLIGRNSAKDILREAE